MSEPRGRSYHEDTHRFRAALAQTEAGDRLQFEARREGLLCSLLLHDLSGPFDQGLVFKGGTCLSKDLDFCISVRPDVMRSERRTAVSPIRDHLSVSPGPSYRVRVG